MTSEKLSPGTLISALCPSDAEALCRLGADPRSDLLGALSRSARANSQALMAQALALGDFPRSVLAEKTLFCASWGHAKCLLHLLAPSQPRLSPDQYDEALALAAARGRARCVEALLPFSDPNHEHCRPLRQALSRGHLESAMALTPATNFAPHVALALSNSIRQFRDDCSFLLMRSASAEDMAQALAGLLADNAIARLEMMLGHIDEHRPDVGARVSDLLLSTAARLGCCKAISSLERRALLAAHGSHAVARKAKAL